MRNFHILVDIKDATGDESKPPILQDIRFELRSGDSIGIIGDSGAGKSSVAKIISGMIPSYWKVRGNFNVNPEDLDILYLSQDPGSAFPPYMTIKRIWEYISANRPKEVKKNLAYLLPRLDLDAGLLHSFSPWLSGGEKQRFLLAMGLAVEPDLLILDEPTGSLDSKSKLRVMDIISEYQNVMSIIAISHDFRFIERLCRRLLFMHHGKIIDSIDFQDHIEISLLTHEYSRLLVRTYRKHNESA